MTTPPHHLIQFHGEPIHSDPGFVQAWTYGDLTAVSVAAALGEDNPLVHPWKRAWTAGAVVTDVIDYDAETFVGGSRRNVVYRTPIT
ncbi:hypothetical protein GCM10010329_28800 [Streptomyces spiroverticillatus]|uniref:Uncharacterized protein n=1 Tax=Streptomyces finlayi TaxID=67296 RepID=A0A919C948_9ACTN|nr:hypothetical protein [Streptomyces finlayi]GHA04422.1 hypothetical protein GCM10010329_28800 [Streptomyces spiroverticillatus]GHC88478.1 hypothetical protein GCM10010334_21210 [Streptomyces finlayi]